MSNRDFGGEIRISLSNGQRLTLRGSLTETLSGASRTVQRNNDGSISGSVELKPYKMEMALEYDPDVDYDALALLKGISVEEVKITQGEIVNYANCMISGDPQFDAMKGEVTGLAVETGVKPVRTPIAA